MRDEAAAAILGAVLVAVGMALWSLAAGLILSGVELVVGAYVAAYMKAQKTQVRR